MLMLICGRCKKPWPCVGKTLHRECRCCRDQRRKSGVFFCGGRVRCNSDQMECTSPAYENAVRELEHAGDAVFAISKM